MEAMNSCWVLVKILILFGCPCHVVVVHAVAGNYSALHQRTSGKKRVLFHSAFINFVFAAVLMTQKDADAPLDKTGADLQLRRQLSFFRIPINFLFASIARPYEIAFCFA